MLPNKPKRRSREAIRLGRRVRKLREGLNLSLIEVAEKCRMDKGHLSKIETGLSEPPPSRLRRIANAMGVSMSAFFDEAP